MMHSTVDFIGMVVSEKDYQKDGVTYFTMEGLVHGGHDIKVRVRCHGSVAAIYNEYIEKGDNVFVMGYLLINDNQKAHGLKLEAYRIFSLSHCHGDAKKLRQYREGKSRQMTEDELSTGNIWV